jgi:hypothetical protein
MQQLVAVVVALIGIVPPLLEWLGARTERRGIRISLGQLKARIEVPEGWIRARRALSTPDDGDQEMAAVHYELSRLFAQYRGLVTTNPIGAGSGTEDLPWLRRAFLLYQPRGHVERRVQVGFHVSLVLSALLLLGLAIPQSGSDPNLAHLVSNPGRLLVLVPCVVVLAILQQRANSLRRARIAETMP